MKKRELLILSIAVFLTIISWVVIEIYKVKNSQIIQEDIQLPEVKRYNIDTSIIEKLKKRNP
jgi:hypothetical protein